MCVGNDATLEFARDVFTEVFPIMREMNVPFTIFISTLRINSEEEDWCNELSRLIIEGGFGKKDIIVDGHVLDTSSHENRMKTNSAVFWMLKKMNVSNREEELNKIREWSGDNGKKPRKEYRMLRSEQIKELSLSPLVTIGFHTVNHPSLGCLSEEEQRYELERSKTEIEGIIGRKITVFAYPFGGAKDYNSKTIEILDSLEVTVNFILITSYLIINILINNSILSIYYFN